MLKLILFFVVAHVVSFVCSIFESVLLSTSSSYVAVMKKKGSPVGIIMEELKSNIDRPLTAILTLNTISHTIGAAGVGASIVEGLGDRYLMIASVILTFTMLYWTEMLPKTIQVIYA